MRDVSIETDLKGRYGQPGRRIAWFVLALSVLAFIIRIVYVLKSHEYTDMHADEMHRAASSLANQGYIGDIFVGSPGKSAHVAPLYPALLGIIYYIFGSETVTGRIAQEIVVSAVTSITIGLLPLITKKARLPMAYGWITGVFMAVVPLNMWTETSGSWEQPYSALVLIMLLWMFCKLHDEDWSRRQTVLLTGLLIAFAALLSPALVPAAVLMFIGEWVIQQGRRKEVALSGLLMFGISLVLVIPWGVRNYYALGGFIPIRSNFGLELAIGNNPQATGKTFITYADDPNSPAYNMHPNSSPKERNRLAQIGERAYMKEKQQMAVQWMKDNPGKAFKLTLTRFRLFWFPTKDAWPRSSAKSLYKSLIFSLIGLWMFGELFELLLFRHPTRWLLAAAVIGPSLIYMVTHADPRYRYPVFGLSTLLACSFLCRAWNFVMYMLRTRVVPEGA
jgi:hypothetical protein